MKIKSMPKWWGTFNFELKQTLFWEIGTLLLGVERLEQEWRIAYDILKNHEGRQVKIATEDCPDFDKKNLVFTRFVFNQTKPQLSITPVLADRAQVSRPDTPFYIPTKENVTIFVSSPAWLRLEVAIPKTVLQDIPSMRLSDTWFGANTLEGELCYASPTVCRTQLADLPQRSHRIITPIKIFNQSSKPLLLEQLSLPLPYLSIYEDENNALWTEELTFKNEDRYAHSLSQSKGPPAIAPHAKLLNGPRLTLKNNNLMTLFYNLLAD